MAWAYKSLSSGYFRAREGLSGRRRPRAFGGDGLEQVVGVIIGCVGMTIGGTPSINCSSLRCCHRPSVCGASEPHRKSQASNGIWLLGAQAAAASGERVTSDPFLAPAASGGLGDDGGIAIDTRRVIIESPRKMRHQTPLRLHDEAQATRFPIPKRLGKDRAGRARCAPITIRPSNNSVCSGRSNPSVRPALFSGAIRPTPRRSKTKRFITPKAAPKKKALNLIGFLKGDPSSPHHLAHDLKSG